MYLDAKIAIASVSPATWHALGADPEFGRFAISDPGRALFLATFTVITTADGVEYRVNGQLHRIGGPAVARPDGYIAWHERDQLHRVGGPAWTWPDGYTAWYERGQLHRVDGPALDHPDGYNAWYERGQRHRVDGPAVTHPDGTTEWYERGVRIR